MGLTQVAWEVGGTAPRPPFLSVDRLSMPSQRVRAGKVLPTFLTDCGITLLVTQRLELASTLTDASMLSPLGLACANHTVRFLNMEPEGCLGGVVLLAVFARRPCWCQMGLLVHTIHVGLKLSPREELLPAILAKRFSRLEVLEFPALVLASEQRPALETLMPSHLLRNALDPELLDVAFSETLACRCCVGLPEAAR